MPALTKDTIDQAKDLDAREKVPVPEWGGAGAYVWIRMLSSWERDEFTEANLVQKGKGKKELELRNLRARLVALTMVDDDGKRLYADEEAPLLGRKSAKVIQRLFDVASKLNGLDDDLEDVAKNSEPGPAGERHSA